MPNELRQRNIPLKLEGSPVCATAFFGKSRVCNSKVGWEPYTRFTAQKTDLGNDRRQSSILWRQRVTRFPPKGIVFASLRDWMSPHLALQLQLTTLTCCEYLTINQSYRAISGI